MKPTRLISPALLLILVGVTLFIGVRPAHGADPELAILSETVTFKEVEPRTEDAPPTLEGVVILQNNTAETMTLSFALVIDGKDAAPTVTAGEAKLAAYTTRSFTLTTESDKPLTGFLTISGGEKIQATCPFTMSLRPEFDLNLLLWGSVLLGYVLPLVGVLLILAWKLREPKPVKEAGGQTAPAEPSVPMRKKLKDKIFNQWINAELEWDFTKNWGSTFTLLGAFFVALSGASLMPAEPQLLSKSAYQLVIVAGPALIALAPMLIASLNSLGRELAFIYKEQTIFVTVGTSGKPPLKVFAYLFGSGVVTLAVTIEIATLLLYLFDLQRAETISSPVMTTSLILITLLWLVGIYYSGERILQVILHAQAGTAIEAAALVAYEKEKNPPPPPPTWTLLSDALARIEKALLAGKPAVEGELDISALLEALSRQQPGWREALEAESLADTLEDLVGEAIKPPIAEPVRPIWTQTMQQQAVPSMKVYLP